MNDSRTEASTASSVDAYEEDWYRSLRALAERRRTELDQFEDDDEPEQGRDEERAGAGNAVPPPESERPKGAGVTPPVAAGRGPEFWATPAPPTTQEPPPEDPRHVEPSAEAALDSPTEPQRQESVEAARAAQPPAADARSVSAPLPARSWSTRHIEPDVVEGREAGAETEPTASASPVDERSESATDIEPRPDAVEDDVQDEARAPEAPPSEAPVEAGGTWARLLRPLRRSEPSPEPRDESGTVSKQKAAEADGTGDVDDSSSGTTPSQASGEAASAPSAEAETVSERAGAPANTARDSLTPAASAEPTEAEVASSDTVVGRSIEVDVFTRPAEGAPDSVDESTPARTPQPEPGAVPRDEPAGPSLASLHAAERRSALVALEEREPTAAELETVAALVLDPDAEIRRLAVDTLARTRVRLDDAVVRQALQDPADEVRAAAVRAAATRGTRDLPTLAPLIEARRWPETHRTVLELLPRILGEAPLTAQDIDPLLLAVAQMQPPPDDDERGAFSDVSAAIGTTLLIEALTLPDVRRLGAVRVLSVDRSHAVLHALAERAGDPLEEVRQAGLRAAQDIARIEAEAAPADGSPDIDALADELGNPDAEHAERARTALGGVDRSDVVTWCRERLAHEDAESVAIVAAVATVLELHEVGVELLTSAAALPAERRRPVLEALADFPDPPRLARLVSTVPADRRPDAVRLVWEAFAQEVLPDLRGLLADPAVEVRVVVIDIVRETDDAAAIEAVAALLASDASPDVRAAAVRTVAAVDGGLANVIRALDDPDAHVRATAVASMPSSPAAEVGQALAQALTDLDQRVRLAAIDRLAGVSRGDPTLAWSALLRCRLEERAELLAALQRTNPEQVLEIALEHLSSSDQEERKLAVEMTGWGASQGAVEAAIRALADPHTEIRRAAVDALGRLRDRSAVAALGNRLGDPEPSVRVGAVRALGVIDDEGVLAFLVAALRDPDHEVRETTSHVLTEWSSPAVAKRLAGVLAVPSLRDSATDLLRRIGPTSVELLIDVLLQGGVDLRSTVGPLLEQIIGVEEFIRRMDALEPERRLRAIEALGAIAGRPAVDALTRSLSDPDERIRLRSTQLLGELGDPVATEAVAPLVDDPVPEVAAAARHALEANLAGRATPPAAG